MRHARLHLWHFVRRTSTRARANLFSRARQGWFWALALAISKPLSLRSLLFLDNENFMKILYPKVSCTQNWTMSSGDQSKVPNQPYKFVHGFLSTRTVTHTYFVQVTKYILLFLSFSLLFIFFSNLKRKKVIIILRNQLKILASFAMR